MKQFLLGYDPIPMDIVSELILEGIRRSKAAQEPFAFTLSSAALQLEVELANIDLGRRRTISRLRGWTK